MKIPTAYVFTVLLSQIVLAQTQYTLPLVMSASNDDQLGLIRIINHSDRAGTVEIYAIDDSGARFGPVSLSLDALEAVNFDSADLEEGNTLVNLSGGVGSGEGNWRLEMSSELDIVALAYIRAADGFVNSMHDVAAEDAPMRYRVPTFNPSTRSLLRLINPHDADTTVTITGRDDRGEPSPEGEVRLTLPPNAACTVTAPELESGDINDCPSAFEGRFGNGWRKWRLLVHAARPIHVMSMLKNPGGQLANLSSSSATAQQAIDTNHTLPLVVSASNDVQQGLVRIINHSDRAGTVEIYAVDDSGARFGPVSLSLDALEAVNFDATDLEEGSASVNLSDGIGNGEGNWRLGMYTDLDIAALAYIRTADGFVNSMHDVIAEDAPMYYREPTLMHYRVPTFNASTRSLLRLINLDITHRSVTITGRDDRGEPAPEGEVRLTLPPRAACTITALELESGDINDCPSAFEGRFGNGTGKWRLLVSTTRKIRVMSLLKNPSGHLANLSSTVTAGKPAYNVVLWTETINFQDGSTGYIDHFTDGSTKYQRSETSGRGEGATARIRLSGTYGPDDGGLPELSVSESAQAPIYYNRGLVVGLDRIPSIGALQIAGNRRHTTIRYGQLQDGLSGQHLRSWLALMDSRNIARRNRPPTVRLAAGTSPEKRHLALLAVQFINRALPIDWRLRVIDASESAEENTIHLRFAELPGNRPADILGYTSAAGDIWVRPDIRAKGEGKAVTLIAHELMHSLGLGAHTDGFASILRSTIDPPNAHIDQPRSLLYPLDREGLRAFFTRYDSRTSLYDLSTWSDRAVHIRGDNPHAAWGAAIQNGLVDAWAFGDPPRDYAKDVAIYNSLTDNDDLSGNVTWSGDFLGFTQAGAAVSGDVTVQVDLADMTGWADFKHMESWMPDAAPGATGTGAMWGDGDLRYTIAVRGNTFRKTGGDAGLVSGVFVGISHAGVGVVLERTDLSAGGGGTRP